MKIERDKEKNKKIQGKIVKINSNYEESQLLKNILGNKKIIISHPNEL